MDLKPPFEAYRGNKPYVFVSYARVDSHIVYPMIGELNREGYRIWYDQGIASTAEWSDEIAQAIEDCSLFIVFVTGISIAREEVKNEIAYARQHGRKQLFIYLEDVELPRAIALGASRFQSFHAEGLERSVILSEIRDKSALAGIEPERQGTVADERGAASGEQVSPDSKPKMPSRPTPGRMSVFSSFADRVGESEALTAAVEHLRGRLNGSIPIEHNVFNNVLVFYGRGGVGKTGLSNRLDAWISGELDDAIDWGGWNQPIATTVRWDFHGEAEALNTSHLLGVLRQSLGTSRHSWLAFDLGLVAFLETVRLSDTSPIGLHGVAEDQVLRSLQTIAAEMGIGVPTQLTSTSIRHVVRSVRESNGRLPDSLMSCDVLFEVIDACARLRPGADPGDALALLMYLLTQEIHNIESESRPTLVFFIDAFESLRRTGRTSNEVNLARIISNLPYCLFVITGRDRVGWADRNRTDLDNAGPAAWPGLCETATADPRQHNIGALSDTDTRSLYVMHRDHAGWQLDDEVIDGLVRRSGGLPLHIDAVLQLIRNLHAEDPKRLLTQKDLDGELPEVVNRLTTSLAPDEATAFRAACVLPAFDIPLVMAVGGVTDGAVRRAIEHGLVEVVPGRLYPYRIHDEIRRLVKIDRHTPGYWSDEDWLAAARRGLEHAILRIKEGESRDSDNDQIEGIVLALRLGYEWGIYADGLANLVVSGPTITGLIPLVPNGNPVRDSDIDHLLRYIHALGLSFVEAPAVLEQIHATHPEISFQIYLWRAYRMRSVKRFDEALELLSEMLKRYSEQRQLLDRQYGVSLKEMRRYADALDYIKRHRPDTFEVFAANLQLELADFTADFRAIEEWAANLRSRRYRQERLVHNLEHRVCRDGVTNPDEIHQYLESSPASRLRAQHAQCLRLLAYGEVTNTKAFNEIGQRLLSHIGTSGIPGRDYGNILALRALATRTPEDIDRAITYVAELVRPPLGTNGDQRSMTLLSTECWLDELGHPLPPLEAQWPIPYEEVKANWVAVAERLIESSRRRHD